MSVKNENEYDQYEGDIDLKVKPQVHHISKEE